MEIARDVKGDSHSEEGAAEANGVESVCGEFEEGKGLKGNSSSEDSTELNAPDLELLEEAVYCYPEWGAEVVKEALGFVMGAVKKVVNNKDLEICVVPFGSLVSSLASLSCDLDIAVYVKGESADEIGRLPLASPERTVRNQLKRQLRQMVLAIPARVPITRFCYYSRKCEIELSVDVSYNNVFGVLNTRLIRSYCHLDARAMALCRLVKHWIACRNLNKQTILSSFAWTVLTLRYLQEICILPNLHQPPIGTKHKPEVLRVLGCEQDVWFLDPLSENPWGRRVDDLGMKWPMPSADAALKKNVSLVEKLCPKRVPLDENGDPFEEVLPLLPALFSGFVDFCRDRRWDSEVVSLRNPFVKKNAVPYYLANAHGVDDTFHIEDPMDQRYLMSARNKKAADFLRQQLYYAVAERKAGSGWFSRAFKWLD